MKKVKYIIGIDEVGRGPVAGPVSVGAVLLSRESSWQDFDGLRDSKKLTEKKREGWFTEIKESGVIYAVSSVGEQVIDERGIAYAIRLALSRSLKKLSVDPGECLVLLDGGLKAPEEYVNQQTIIKGDEKEHVIALASIVAKVTRDRYMTHMGKRHPEYCFEQHKGYGTKRHYEAIEEHGLCPLHRRSFLRGF
ncbi:MAG: ribonuclease HII [Candidatus Pacebacteria bacterium]|nr:ribonuclease HII [Candidatus Paceibacterota bacterium]